MLKILQARLQQYVNHELPDVQDGFRKGRRTRDQIANIHWIMEKTREFQKTSISALPWGRRSRTTPRLPRHRGDEGLRLLHGLEANLATSLQTPQEA